MDQFDRLFLKIQQSLKSKTKTSKFSEGSSGIHLPYLVCLLQTAGYHLSKVECINPKHITQKGVSIVVSCGYSGQRCFLSYPETDPCNCFIKGEESGDFFLEAVSRGNVEERWLQNKDKSQYCLPFISESIKSFCKLVVIELVTLMTESFIENRGVLEKAELSQNKAGTAINSSQTSYNSTTAVSQTCQRSTTQTVMMKTEMSRVHTTATYESVSSVESSVKKTCENKSSAVTNSVKSLALPKENGTNKGPSQSSLIPRNSLGNKGKTTTNLKAPVKKVSVSQPPRLSTANSKSTPNLAVVGNSNKYTTSQLKVFTPKVCCTVDSKGPTAQKTNNAKSSVLPSKLQVPKTTLSKSPISKGKSSSTVPVSSITTKTTTSEIKKSTLISTEKTEKVIRVTSKSSGSSAVKK